MKKSEIEAQAMVTLDAIEAEDPRAPKLLAPILKVVRAHGRREGRADYEGRAGDVAAGQQDPEWAWPLSGADGVYFNAVGISGITNEIGIPERLWEQVSDVWLDAFRRGYVAAHEGSTSRTRKKKVQRLAASVRQKSAAQLDREIIEALRPRRTRTTR